MPSELHFKIPSSGSWIWINTPTGQSNGSVWNTTHWYQDILGKQILIYFFGDTIQIQLQVSGEGELREARVSEMKRL